MYYVESPYKPEAKTSVNLDILYCICYPSGIFLNFSFNTIITEIVEKQRIVFAIETTE